MEEHKKVKFKVFSSYSHVSAKIKKFCNAQKSLKFYLVRKVHADLLQYMGRNLSEVNLKT